MWKLTALEVVPYELQRCMHTYHLKLRTHNLRDNGAVILRAHDILLSICNVEAKVETIYGSVTIFLCHVQISGHVTTVLLPTVRTAPVGPSPN